MYLLGSARSARLGKNRWPVTLLGDEARLIFITHEAYERDVAATLHDLKQLDVVGKVGSVLRVVGDA